MSLTRRGLSRIAARCGKFHSEKEQRRKGTKTTRGRKRRKRMWFERMWFCCSQNFNVESCGKLLGRGKMSSDDIFPTPTIFYVKTRMCKCESKSHRTKKCGFKD
jgi:hypothetical protein